MIGKEPAVMVHDTQRIIAVNKEACELFRCEPLALIDSDLLDLIASEDMRGLAALRMRVMRERGVPLPNIKYPFFRCDGSIFWGSVFTREIPDGFETTIIYEFEK